MKLMIDVKRAVMENRRVKFVKYFDGDLWYETEFGEQFPVPISEAGTASFLAEDKALLFMRYMKKENERVSKD
jgi:hypothetical protein